MNPELPTDALAPLADAEVQRQAAHMAQDAFSRLFRLTLDAEPTEVDAARDEIARRSATWAQASASDDARALRLALLIAGLDQWGLAYTQAFGLSAIPALSDLLGQLRTGLDAQADARFAQQFAALDAAEGNAIDFRMETRRQIHLALWHALIASDAADAERIATTLGSLLLALNAQLPTLGWRLVADSLAHIQVGCLQVGAGETAMERTQRLFASLRQALPAERAQAAFSLANQAAAAWQQAQRQPVH